LPGLYYPIAPGGFPIGSGVMQNPIGTLYILIGSFKNLIGLVNIVMLVASNCDRPTKKPERKALKVDRDSKYTDPENNAVNPRYK
jgi:hypothetical protein